MRTGRTVAVAVAVLLIAGFGTSALAQVHHEVALTRSIIQAERQAIVAANLPMPEEQSKAFWPVYREYRGALAKVGDRFVALVENYANSYENMTDAAAQPIIDEMFAIQKEELKIKMDWLPKLAKVLPPATLARFIQIENKLDAIIRFELADEIPLAETMPKGK
jgi:hypothetical protein